MRPVPRTRTGRLRLHRRDALTMYETPEESTRTKLTVDTVAPVRIC